jgi:hypothetical protein
LGRSKEKCKTGQEYGGTGYVKRKGGIFIVCRKKGCVKVRARKGGRHGEQ